MSAPDEQPAERKHQDRDDPRPDIQQAVESRKDEAIAAGGGARESVGSTDGPNGAGGDVRNQDDMAQ